MTPLAIGILILLIILVTFLRFIKQILHPIYRLLTASRVPTIVRTPDDRFTGLEDLGYNFTSNYVELDGGCGVKLPRVHYLDEGPRDGKVILCLHGEPSWSFLYRHMVPVLANAGYRVIVPDFIGFGKSDKYSSATNYTHEMHMMTLRFFIDHLNLQEITLVCQDWGGLVGLSVVKDCPMLFSSLVVMNTGLPSPIVSFSGEPSIIKKVLSLLPLTLWFSCVNLLGSWIPLGLVYKIAFTRFKLDNRVISGYLAPHPTPMYCGGVKSWPLMLPFFKDDAVTQHMWEARNCLKLWKKPVLVMFSDSDPITRGQDKMFLKLVPKATHVTIKGAGHFLQETHGDELAVEIIKFVSHARITQL